MKSYSKFTYQVLRSESPFSTVLLFSFEPFSLACRCQKTKGSRIIWLLPITIGGEKGVKQRSRQTFSRERKAGREWENRHISGPYSSEQSWRRFVLRLSPARSNRFLLRPFLFLWHPGKVAGCRLAGRARVPTLSFLCFPRPFISSRFYKTWRWRPRVLRNARGNAARLQPPEQSSAGHNSSARKNRRPTITGNLEFRFLYFSCCWARAFLIAATTEQDAYLPGNKFRAETTREHGEIARGATPTFEGAIS